MRQVILNAQENDAVAGLGYTVLFGSDNKIAKIMIAIQERQPRLS